MRGLARQIVGRSRMPLGWRTAARLGPGSLAGAGRLPVIGLGVVVALAGCIPLVGQRPPNVFDPEVSGLVTGAARFPGTQTSYRMDVGGQQITIDTQDTQKLYTDFIDDGVVLYGADPRAWYIGTSPPLGGCYLVTANLAFDDPDAVILAFDELSGVGIRVPKAPGFDPGSELSDHGAYAGQYISRGAPSFCFDAQGRMARSASALPPPTASP